MGVAVVSPSLTLRVGLSSILQSLDSVQITAQAASLEELGDLPALTEVLVYASWEALPFKSLELGAPILVLTNEPATEQSLSLLNSRFAWGMLSLDASSEELLAALQALRVGLWVGAPGCVALAFGKQQIIFGEEENSDLVENLTERETEVLQQVAQGLSNKQIAVKLGISENTVKYHIASIYSKLEVSNRTEAVRIGARKGWIAL